MLYNRSHLRKFSFSLFFLLLSFEYLEMLKLRLGLDDRPKCRYARSYLLSHALLCILVSKRNGEDRIDLYLSAIRGVFRGIFGCYLDKLICFSLYFGYLLVCFPCLICVCSYNDFRSGNFRLFTEVLMISV